MLRQRNALTFVVGLGVWLAVVLLAATAILSFTDQVSAQQSSTESMLSTPTLSVQAGENRVDLSWTAVTGAARYELWAWTSAGGWQRLDEGTLTATTYSHTELTAGTTYYYWVRAVNGSGEMSAWSERTSATVAAAPSSLVPYAHIDADFDAAFEGLSAFQACPDRGGRRSCGRIELDRDSWRPALCPLDLDQRRRLATDRRRQSDGNDPHAHGRYSGEDLLLHRPCGGHRWPNKRLVGLCVGDDNNTIAGGTTAAGPATYRYADGYGHQEQPGYRCNLSCLESFWHQPS